jgi:hypothetical protein
MASGPPLGGAAYEEPIAITVQIPTLQMNKSLKYNVTDILWIVKQQIIRRIDQSSEICKDMWNWGFIYEDHPPSTPQNKIPPILLYLDDGKSFEFYHLSGEVNE